jgi:hypothetical protein
MQMATTDFTITVQVGKTPDEAFVAIGNPRAWWSEEIEGNTNTLDEEFNYHFEDIHRCRLKVVEVVPNKKIVWQVMDNYFKPGIFGEGNASPKNIGRPDDRAEWVGTRICFEISEKDKQTLIRFTHLGLVPEYECFDVCSNGWNHYIRQSLVNLINTGKGEPNKTGSPMTVDEERFHSASQKP